MRIEDPCHCAACEARRLAWRIFLTFLAVIVFFGFVHRNDGQGQINISPAAYRDQCGAIHPDILDRPLIRGGTAKRRSNGVA